MKSSLILCILLFSPTKHGDEEKLDFILQGLANVLANTKEVQFKVSKAELFGNEMKRGESVIHYHFAEDKTYIRTIKPKADIEVNYSPNAENEAEVHADFFPYLTVNLDIYGFLMLRDQHHPVSNINFKYFINLVCHYISKAKLQNQCHLNNGKDVSGNNVWKLSFSAVGNQEYTYQVKKEQTFIQLTTSKKLNPYLVLQLNPDVTEYGQVLEKNQSITLTEHYADKAEILISKTLQVPTEMKFWRKNELFEHYVFSDILLK